MHGMPLAPLAVLLVLDPLRVLLLIFLGSVITPLALHTRQGDQGTHQSSHFCTKGSPTRSDTQVSGYIINRQ